MQALALEKLWHFLEMDRLVNVIALDIFFINKKINTFLFLNEHMLLVFTEAPH